MNEYLEPIKVETPESITIYDSALIVLKSAVPHLSPRQATAIIDRLGRLGRLERIEELAAKTVFGYRENQGVVRDEIIAEFVEVEE